MISFTPECNTFNTDLVIKFDLNSALPNSNHNDYILNKLENLLKTLHSVGLSSAVRWNTSKHSLLIFTRMEDTGKLNQLVYSSRLHDWLNGVRLLAPKIDCNYVEESENNVVSINDENQGENLHEAERLRIVHNIIVNEAGITPGQGPWKNVSAIFPLHDEVRNQRLLRRFGQHYFLTITDLDAIRNAFGESVALYFAFAQAYCLGLIGPLALGLLTWKFPHTLTPFYAVLISIWCIGFTEFWMRKEQDLAVRWGVEGVSRVQARRRQFKAQHTIVDEITGEAVPVFPLYRQLLRQSLQIPFGLVAVAVLACLIAGCFAIEVFVTEMYTGPLKWCLVYLPTGILSILMPLLKAAMTRAAQRLTEFENYETDAEFEAALTLKVFALEFITSYWPIYLTAFVYVPFGRVLMPYLTSASEQVLSEVYGVNAKGSQNSGKSPLPNIMNKGDFSINPERLQRQVIYFTFTAQIVHFITDFGIPFLKRQGSLFYRERQTSRAKHAGTNPPNIQGRVDGDKEGEVSFLRRARHEANLDVYNVHDDMREMVIQFGYLALFSVVWPLASVSFFITDWLELRADAYKIVRELRRSLPRRVGSIGPWIDSLAFLSWIGSITSAAATMAVMTAKSGIQGNIELYKILTIVIAAEHIYFIARYTLRHLLGKLESPGQRMTRRARYTLRKRYVNSMLSNRAGREPEEPKLGKADGDNTQPGPEKGSGDHPVPDGVAPQQNVAKSGFWNNPDNWRESFYEARSLIQANSQSLKPVSDVKDVQSESKKLV